MSLRRHLIKGLGSAQKIALAASTFVMTIALPVIAKADVISTPRIGRSSSFLAMAAISNWRHHDYKASQVKPCPQHSRFFPKKKSLPLRMHFVTL